MTPSRPHIYILLAALALTTLLIVWVSNVEDTFTPRDPNPRFEVIPRSGSYTVRYCKTAEPLSTCKKEDLIEEPCVDNCYHFFLPVPPPSQGSF